MRRLRNSANSGSCDLALHYKGRNGLSSRLLIMLPIGLRIKLGIHRRRFDSCNWVLLRHFHDTLELVKTSVNAS